MGLPYSAIDFNYCRRVLQKHWRMNCDHLPMRVVPKPSVRVPPHDSSDPVQVLLIANADHGDDELAPQTGWSPPAVDAPPRRGAH